MRRPHEHHWTEWGWWDAKLPDYSKMRFCVSSDEPPEYTPVEAYRWRYCECGAAEREDYQGLRTLFERED